MQVPLLILIFSLLAIFLAITLSVKLYKERVPQTILMGIRRKTDQEERRTHPRHSTSLRIKYRTLMEGGLAEGMSWIRNVSRGGMKLFLDRHIEEGTFLTLEIDLPFERNPAFARSSIVWKEGDEAGVIFDEIKDEDLDRILEYIEQRTQLNS